MEPEYRLESDREEEEEEKLVDSDWEANYPCRLRLITETSEGRYPVPQNCPIY